MKRTLALIFITCVAGWAAPAIKDSPIVTPERLALTRDYAQRHYGIDDYQLKEPLAIVIHYTATRTWADTLRVFRPARLSARRKELSGFGDLNVGVHFVVDRDGTIYRLLPEDVMGRHAIGLNYCAFGIENVALDAAALTAAQLESNVWLVKDLARRHGTIGYLLGHHELPEKNAPHAALLRAQDPAYKPGGKSDPGPEFMRRLRGALSRAGIDLQR